ncbi:MAG: PHB depolymerase family esterase [Bradyrhizobium sp.]|nr:PHB depolymerase family esterase [Bradyrhizobium sp.]
MSLANNVDFLRRLPKLDRLNELGRGLRPEVESPLLEIGDFGPNPGALRMFAFVPDKLQQPRALVVVLHGCGQTAAGYDHGAGWSTLAQHFGFALLIPEQQLSNNANGCFNWFSPEDVTRDHGEVASIRQMIARMVEDHGIDQRHIFVTGLSAGGAMTSAMLATYPEVFSAGAIIAGVPYGVANNVREALAVMHATPVRTPRRLGDLVRKASHHPGPWPRLSVWHGSADGVVAPANAREIVKQWLDLHHLPQAPMSEGMVDGYPRRVWWNADGETIVESYTITAMAHGTPLGAAENEQRYGARGAFMLEAGISSSYHIAKFFGLTGWIAESGPKPEAKKASKPARKPAPTPAKVNGPSAPIIPPVPMPDFTEVFDPLTMMQARAERTQARAERTQARGERTQARAETAEKEEPRRRGIDVGAVITRALTAAGLMK